MEDISLPHDTRVEDILADYFTKKIEGKDAETKEKHSDSQHSSKSKKSKKRKHKKKKKHKSRKAHSENEEEEDGAGSTADECWVEVTAGGDAKGSTAKKKRKKAGSAEREPAEKPKDERDPDGSSAPPATSEAAAEQAMPSKAQDEKADKDHSESGQKEPKGESSTEQQVEISDRSPRKASRSPRKASRSPRKSSRSPRKSSQSSRKSSRSPRKLSRSPRKSSQSSRKSSRSPRKSSRSPRKSSRSASPARNNRSSSSSDSEDDKKTASVAGPASQSVRTQPPKKPAKKARSYRTKRCRSSGSSEDEDAKSNSVSRSPSRGNSLDRSRARSGSRSRRNSDVRRNRSKSRDQRRGRSRERSRERRSSRSRSRRRGQDPSYQRRSSPGRSRVGRSRSPRRPEYRRSRSPVRTRGARSRSLRRSRSPARRSPRRSPRQSQIRRRSESRRRTQRSRSHSPRRTRRSRSLDRRGARKSVSPSPRRARRSRSLDKRAARKSISPRRSRKSRSHSRKRSTSRQRQTSRRSRSHSDAGGSRSRKRSTSINRQSSRRSRSGSDVGDRKSSSKSKNRDRDSSSREKTPRERSMSSDSSDERTANGKKDSVAKASEEKTGKAGESGKKGSDDSDKNQVVLYGPFEEEEANFTEEEPSPERSKSSAKPAQHEADTEKSKSSSKVTQPEACSAPLEGTSKSQPGNTADEGFDVVPLPSEPPASPTDSQLEDMDISDSPSSVGVLEVEDSDPTPSEVCASLATTTSRDKDEPQRAPPEEPVVKTLPARAAIPWNYNEVQPPPPPPWVKPEISKPVGQVRPFVREVCTEVPAVVQKGIVQAKQDGLGVIGTLATLPPVAESAIGMPGKPPACGTEALHALASTIKASEQPLQASLAGLPAVSQHGNPMYSATVMPVHVPMPFVSIPGHAQAFHSAAPAPQEKPVAQLPQESSSGVRSSLATAPASGNSTAAAGDASKVQGTEGKKEESTPASPPKEAASQQTQDAKVSPDASASNEAKSPSGSPSSSRSSSPSEKGRSRSSSVDKARSHKSRSPSPSGQDKKRLRSGSESPSPSKSTKRPCGDATDTKRGAGASGGRRSSPSLDRSRRDSRDRKKSRSPDRKREPSRDRKRSGSRGRKRSKSRDRKRSKSRDRRRSPERRRSKSREKRRSKSRDRRRSRSLDRRRSRSPDRRLSSRNARRSRSWDRRRSRDRLLNTSRDRRRSSSRDRRQSGSRLAPMPSRRRSASRSRRSRSRDRARGQSRSRDGGRSRRSQSKDKSSSRRRSSRERSSPRGGLILKRYKNVLSSDSDSSPERKSKKTSSSPVKKKAGKGSDVESSDSEESRRAGAHSESSKDSEAPESNKDDKAGSTAKEAGKGPASSEKEADMKKAKSPSRGRESPAKATTTSDTAATAAKPEQPGNVEMATEPASDAKSDAGKASLAEQSARDKEPSVPVVSSSSSTKEEEHSPSRAQAAVSSSSGESVGSTASAKDTVRRDAKPPERKESCATSSDKNSLVSKPDGSQPNLSDEKVSSAGEKTSGGPVDQKHSGIESEPSSSTGDLLERGGTTGNDKAATSSPHREEKSDEDSLDKLEASCVDSGRDSSERQPCSTAAKELTEPSSSGDAADTVDKRQSRSRSRSNASSIEKARTRKDSSSSSSSPSRERKRASKEKSRSASPESRSTKKAETKSQEKKSQGNDRKRSQSREKKRSKSREKKRSRSREKKGRSRSREKKRSASREKKRSKSREKRRSRSRDKRSRSKEKKRSRSEEKRRSRSREKRRSRSREKRRSRSRDKKRSRSRERRKSRSRDRKRSKSREKRRSRSRDTKRSPARDKRRSRSRERRRSLSRDRRRSRDRRSSSRSRDRRRSRSRERRRSRSRGLVGWGRPIDLLRRRSAERSRRRTRSPPPLPRKRSLSKRRSPRKKSRSRSRSRRRSRTHSPERKRKSRSREREPSVVKVDKAQLLEAARKNMQAMLQRGVVAKGLPVAAAAAVNATVKVVAAAVAAAAADPRSTLAAKLDVTTTPPREAPVLPLAMSGDGTGPSVTLGVTEEPPKVKRSLAALTEICKAISDEEKREYAGEVEPKTAEEVAEEFQQTHHHPFKLKDPPPPIRFNIPNATNLPVKTLAEKVADAAHLHKQFPVSSGNQHRVKELEWVPVEKTEQPAKALRAAKRTPLAGKEGGPSSPPPLLALMPPAPSSTNTFSPLPTVAAPPVFQVEEVPQPVSSAVVTSTVAEPTDAPASKLQDKAKTKPEKGSENGLVKGNSADNRSLSTEKKSLPVPEEKARLKPEKRENGSEDRRRGTGIVDNKNARPNEKTPPARKIEPLPQREVQHNKSGWLPQRETERNIFAEDVDLTILFEDIPLESIPLPEGPYIPPHNGRPHLDSPLPKEQPTKEAARKPAVVPSDEKPKRRSKWDIPPSDQRLESDTLNQKESTTLSAKPKSLEQKELETCRKAQAEVQRPKAETKQQEVAPSAQPVKETKTKDVPPREVSSKSSELDRQQKQTAEQRLPRRSPAEQLLETNKKDRESQPETPREAKERMKPEQVSKPSRQEAKEGTKPEQLSKTSKQEANEGTKPEQSSKSGDIREKLKKLRRESIMSVLDLEPFETGVKASPAPPASKVEEDGASLCRKGWNAIPQYQREAAYFSLDKTKAQKPRGPLRSEGAAASKADVRDSPRPITTKKPEFKLSKDKPASSTSAGTTDQDALSSRTTAGQRKWDQFLRRQIQGNVVTQPMPGYLSFGNKIVNPAPSVRPPVKEQTASTSKDANRPSAERHEKKASPPERVRPAARAESVTVVEGTAMKKQPPKDSSAAQLKGAAEAKPENLPADLPAEKNAPTKVTMNVTSSEELNRKNAAEPEKPSAKLPTDNTTPEEKMVAAMTAPLKSSNDAQQEEMLAVTLPESTAITEKAEAAAQAPLQKSIDAAPENLPAGVLRENTTSTEGKPADEVSPARLDKKQESLAAGVLPESATVAEGAEVDEKLITKLARSTDQESENLSRVSLPENAAPTETVDDEISEAQLKKSVDEEVKPTSPVSSPQNAALTGIAATNEISQAELQRSTEKEVKDIAPVVVPALENVALTDAATEQLSQGQLKTSGEKEAENTVSVPSPENAVTEVGANEISQVPSPEKVTVTEETAVEVKNIRDQGRENVGPVPPPENTAFAEAVADETSQAELKRSPAEEAENMAAPSPERAPVMAVVAACDDSQVTSPEKVALTEAAANEVCPAASTENATLVELEADERSQIPSAVEAASTDEMVQAQLKEISNSEVEHISPVLLPDNSALTQEKAKGEMAQAQLEKRPEPENLSTEPSPENATLAEVADEMLQAQRNKRNTDQEKEDASSLPLPENTTLTEETAAKEMRQAEVERNEEQGAENVSTVSLPEHAALTGAASDETSHIPPPEEEVTSAVETAADEILQAQLKRSTAEVESMAPVLLPENVALVEVAADEMPQMKRSTDKEAENRSPVPSPQLKRHTDQEAEDTLAAPSPENAPLTEAAANETSQAELTRLTDQEPEYTSPETAPMTEVADEMPQTELKTCIDQVGEDTISLPSPENALLTEEAVADETSQVEPKRRSDQETDETSAVISPQNTSFTEAAADETLQVALKERIDQDAHDTSPENAPLTEAAADETLPAALKQRIDQQAQDTSPENAPFAEAAADETLPAALKERIDQQAQDTSPENASLTDAAADETLPAVLKERIDQQAPDTSPENAPLAEAVADETLQAALKEHIDQEPQDISLENAPLTEAAADETLQAALKERIDQQAQDTSPENAPLTEAAADETLQAALKERTDQEPQDTSPENAPLTEAAADETLPAALKECIDQQAQDTSPENAPLTEAAAVETLQAALKERIDQQAQDTSPENAPLAEAAADETLEAALKERIDQQAQDTLPENAPLTDAAADETLQAVLKERIDQEAQDTSPENGPFTEVVVVEMSQAGLKTLTDQEAQDTSLEKTSLTGSAAADSEMSQKQHEEEEAAVIQVGSIRSYSKKQRDDSADMRPALLEVVTDRPQNEAVGIECGDLPMVLAPMAAESQIETALEQGATEQTGLSSTLAEFEPESTYEPILAVETNEPVEVAAEIECALSPRPSAENVETESASLAVQETVQQMQYDTSETREHGITQDAQIHQPQTLATGDEQDDSHTAPSARYVAVESEQSLLYQNEASPTKADLGSDSSLTEEYQDDFGDEAVVEADQVHRDNVSAEDKDSVELAVPAMVLEQAGTEETGLEQPLPEGHADGVAGGSLEDQPTIIIWQHPGLPTLPQEDIVSAEDKDTAEDSLSVMVLEQADTKEESLDWPPTEDQTSELSGDYESERGSVESQPAIIIWRHPGLPASPEDTQAKAAPFVPTVETGRLEQVNLDADRLAQTMQASILPADEQAMSHVPEHDTGTPVCNVEDSVVERTETTELRGHKDSDDTKQTQDAERVENVKDDTNALATTPLRDSSVEAELECAATIQEQSTDSTEGYYEGTSKWETLSEELTPPSSPLRGEDSSSVQASAASTVQDIQPVDSILEPQDIEVASVIEISTEEILVDAAAEDVCTRFETRHEELANEGASQLNLNLPTDNAAASPVPSLPSEDTCTDVLQQVAPIDLSLHHPVPPSPLPFKENPPRSSHEELEAAISRLTLTPETDQRTASTHPMTTEVRSPGLPDRPCESLTTDLSGTTTKDTEQLPRPTPERSVLEPSEVNPEDSQTSAPPTLPASETDGEKLSSDNTESAQLIDETIDETPLEPSTSSRKRKAAGRRQATRRRAANSLAEPAPPSKRARVQSSEVSPAEPETKEPESAVAKPKRKKQSAEECPKADAEPVMPLRRSTRSRKQTQRFCF